MLPLLASAQLFGDRLPSWIQNPPKSNTSFFAIGKGTSSNLDVAERKARLDANVGLAKQVEPVVETTTSRLAKSLRNNKVILQKIQVVRKTVVANLHDTKTVEKHKSENNGSHTVFILVEMPKQNISKAIVTQINADKTLYQALANKRSYKKLLAELE